MERVRDGEGKDCRQGIMMMAMLVLHESESESESAIFTYNPLHQKSYSSAVETNPSLI